MVGFGIEFKKHLTLQSEFNFFPEGDYYKYNENNMIVPYKLNQNYFVFKIAYRFNIHLK